MGGGNWSNDAYQNLSTNYKTKSQKQVFTNTTLSKDMSPHGIKFRESRDSVEHPESLAIAVFTDVTGSMGDIPEFLIKNKLGTLMDTIISNGVKDPQLFFGAVGDHYSDKYPLQIGQFESSTELIDKWLTSIVLEGNGGGQGRESYLLTWLWCARHTSIDCFEKRGQKGFLFTIGDEMCWEKIEAQAIKDILGYGEAQDVFAKQLFDEVRATYHTYHVHVAHGYRGADSDTVKDWRGLIAENLLVVDDQENVGEVIASTVAVMHGADLADVVKHFSKGAANSVTNALATISKSVTKAEKGVVKL